MVHIAVVSAVALFAVAAFAVEVPAVAGTAAGKYRTAAHAEGQHTAAGDTCEGASAAVGVEVEEAAETGDRDSNLHIPGLGRAVPGIPIVVPLYGQHTDLVCHVS